MSLSINYFKRKLRMLNYIPMLMLLVFCMCIFVRIYVHFVYFGLVIGIGFLQSPAIAGDCYVLVELFMVAVALLFSSSGFFFLSFNSFFLLLFSSPNLSGRRLDVYDTSTHGVVLV